MQKIYVLLRQDQQTGPYSLQELVQFDLKPYDLIWIEGQSAGWYYPQEIAALHPHLSFIPKKPAGTGQVPPAEKKVAVQMPVGNNPSAVTPLPHIADAIPTEFYRPSKPVSENLEESVYAQFRQPAVEKELPVATTSAPRDKKAPNAVVVGITTVLVVGGMFAASWIMNRQPAEETTTATIAKAPEKNEIVSPAVVTEDNLQRIQAVSVTKKKRGKNSSSPAQAEADVKPIPKQTREEKISASHPADEATEYEMTGKTTPDEPAAKEETSPIPDETTTAPQEKKKTVKERFLDLFRKRPDENGAGERRPAETENGERVATRRESNLLQSVRVRFDVPNDWMMGIKGAKATLVNRSSETIQKATVEVQYFDDDDQLLQKKTISFDKVGGKESKTVSIPDHATATKVDYSIVSVVGKPAA